MAKKPPKVRADALLVEQGLAEDVHAAVALVMSGKVIANEPDGRELKVEKPGQTLRASTRLRLKGKPRPYVSRAGGKLAGALDAFGIDPAGWVCGDFGLSTGGFTDCLLSRGATRVHGVDVAYGIVDWRLRTDPRLVLHERTNARHLPEDAFGERVRLAVIDVSFISVATILPGVVAQLAPDADVVILVKPQFEADRADNDGGVVTSDAARDGAVRKVVDAAEHLGLTLAGRVDASVVGADGNREILVHLQRRRT